MKNKILACIVLTLVSTSFFVVKQVQAAEKVGNESYEVSWAHLGNHEMGDKFHLYYGQQDGNHEGNAIFDGLDGRSRRVRLNHLKPCTTYNWSVKTRKGGVWSWIIRGHQFVTGGTCEAAKTPVYYGASLVQDITTSAVKDGPSSSTISWSVYPNANKYHVYYRPSWETKYVHSVTVPSNGNSVTIGALQPGATYYYKVAAVVNNVEYWYPEKTLQLATGKKPVLGTQTKNSKAVKGTTSKTVKGTTTTNMGGTNVKGATTCSNNGTYSVSIRTPGGVNVDRVHVLYGTEPGKYVHALRNLEQKAREVTIGALDTCKTYYYQVQVVGTDGRTYWQGEKMMNAH